MIFIDWISPPNHASFNKAFFQSIKIEDPTFVAFHDELRISDVNCHIISSANGRLRRFVEVVKTIRRYSSEQIFLLSYDPLLVPLLMFFKSEMVFVFEHNTTPSDDAYLKILFQFLLYRRLFRFAQFPGQQRQLQRFSKHSAYLGSPLRLSNGHQRKINASDELTFIYPSPRADISELLAVASDLRDYKIIVKREFVKDALDKLPENVMVIDRINLEDYSKTSLVFLIAIETEIRGSGWFNEAVAYNAIIVHLNDVSSNLFSETFPNFQSYHIEAFKTTLQMGNIEKPHFSKRHISDHNLALSERFHAVVER